MARAMLLGNDVKRESSAATDPSPGRMRCWRCRGLMIVESSFDCAGDTVQLDCLTRRCVQCGEVIDPVILQNRRLQLGKTVARVQAEQ